MRKFICKIIIFLLIIGIPFTYFNYIYKNTNYYLLTYEQYEVKNAPEDITLLNLGNSHERDGLRYEKFYNGTSNNFALSSQPFYYSYQILVNNCENINDNAVVLIPISYFDWYFDYKGFCLDDKTLNDRYYGMLNPNQMLLFDVDDYFNMGVFPILSAGQSVQNIYNDLPEPNIEPINETVVNNVEDIAELKCQAWNRDIMADDDNKESVYQDNLRCVKNIIDYCYEKGYVPVLLVSPVTRTLTETMGEEFIADFDEKNNKLVSLYPDILFLDYSRDEQFCDNLEYFKDSDHLNSIGGDVYTQRVLADLVEYGVLEQEDLK